MLLQSDWVSFRVDNMDFMQRFRHGQTVRGNLTLLCVTSLDSFLSLFSWYFFFPVRIFYSICLRIFLITFLSLFSLLLLVFFFIIFFFSFIFFFSLPSFFLSFFFSFSPTPYLLLLPSSPTPFSLPLIIFSFVFPPPFF